MMRKTVLGIAAALMLTACHESKQQETTQTVDKASIVTELMMSRRSIRAYKDSVISRETLNEILKCGINAPNGQNLQSYEIRVIDSPALIDSITQAVVKDNPKIAEREGFKNIFVNAPCVICIAHDTHYSCCLGKRYRLLLLRQFSTLDSRFAFSQALSRPNGVC